MEDIIGNYCHATISHTENQSNDEPYESLFSEDNLSIEDNPRWILLITLKLHILKKMTIL